MQQGRYAGKVIASRIIGQALPQPFHYFDKGNMAAIGRNFAILESGWLRLSGLIAWLAWAAIHEAFLPQAGSRVMVFMQWAGSYVTKQSGSRLIPGPHATPIKVSDTRA